VRNDFDGAGLPGFSGTPLPGEAVNTPGLVNQVVVEPLVINEFVANHSGADLYEFVELYGAPGGDYSQYSILVVEGDSANQGVIDSVIPAGVANPNGFWASSFLSNALENGTLTLLLVEGFSGSLGDDLDSDNDGGLDLAPWLRIADGVAVNDGDFGDAVYAQAALAPGFDGSDFVPGGASRIPNGVDTDSNLDWMRNDYDGAGLPGMTGSIHPGEAYNTPGQVNAALLPTELRLSKDAPAAAATGDLITYTLTAVNRLGIDLVNLVISDSLPAGNAEFAYVLQGGTLNGEAVVWTVSSLPNWQQVAVQFAVTVTGQAGAVVTNQEYLAWAGNYLTPTYGVAVTTAVLGDYTVPAIQGSGGRSPLVGMTVRTQGVVTGRFQGNSSAAGDFNGMFIQDPAGDGAAGTSDGIFINLGTQSATWTSGRLVEVTGVVEEFSEYDGAACSGEDCLTQLRAAPGDIREIGMASLPSLEYNPPGGAAANLAYAEALEGMHVFLPVTATVVGPTNFGTIQVLRGDAGVERVLRNTPYEEMQIGVRPDERYGAGAPNLIAGSVVDGVGGPVIYSYGDYLIADQDGYTVLKAVQPPAQAQEWPAAADNFTAASFNTLGFDSAGGVHFTKVLSTVQQMNAPTFLALQEVAVSTVITDFIQALQAAGYPYGYASSHPDAGGHGIVLLWRLDQVSNAAWTTDYQDCSVVGSESSTYDPLWDACRDLGQYPLFARRPVVLSGLVQVGSQARRVIVIVNHFKSKLGGVPADQRRLEEAQFIHTLVQRLSPGGVTPVLVLGDLNDYEDSPPLQALYAGGVLTSAWFSLPTGERYSYVYQGASQVLDHILATPGLLASLEAFAPLHYNSDFPYAPYSTNATVIWRTSDHDPVAATFGEPAPPAGWLYLPLLRR
jgi:uncharacterized repeat protein (TIGR01451 family)